MCKNGGLGSILANDLAWPGSGLAPWVRKPGLWRAPEGQHRWEICVREACWAIPNAERLGLSIVLPIQTGTLEG